MSQVGWIIYEEIGVAIINDYRFETPLQGAKRYIMMVCEDHSLKNHLDQMSSDSVLKWAEELKG